VAGATGGAGAADVDPEALDRDLSTVKQIVLGTMRALKDAHDAGFYFASDGSEGPFLADVLLHDGKIKMVDVEPLTEAEEGEDVPFNMEALVQSPIGEYVRAWWMATAHKLGIDPNNPGKVSDAHQAVLNNYGTLNWLLFSWDKKDLDGHRILSLVVNGPSALKAEQPQIDSSLQAHWEDFMNRAFVMLGPRRFDEIKAMNDELSRGEIAMRDLVHRSRYCMGAEFEGLHLEYLAMLKQAGYDLSAK